MTTSQTDELVDEKTVTEDGDHDTFSHYVAKDKILESQVTGTPARAICGKLWTPTKDASKFPVCPECTEIYETLKDE